MHAPTPAALEAQARRTAQMDTLRTMRMPAYGAALADAETRAQRVAPGLVSVSTSRPRLPVALEWASNCITVDAEMARVTRLRKSVGVAAKLLENLPGFRRTQKLMVTLTYAGTNANWRPDHISAYIQRVRKWFMRQTGGEKLRYVWVAELQERGVIHYHAVFWMPRALTMPKADKRGWWPHGMTKTEVARKPIGYLMSYVSKISSKNVTGFPHGARISGHGGLDKSGRDIRRWVLWPSYVQGNAQVGDRWKPAKGGGFINHDSGEFLRAEWAPTGGGFSSFIRVHTHERQVDASGPFSWCDAAKRVLH